MTLANGTYYIENHFSHTSLADPSADPSAAEDIDAQQYTDPTRQNVRHNLDSGGLTTHNRVSHCSDRLFLVQSRYY